MITEPLSTKELRRQVAEVLANYGLSVDEFLKADIDDLESDDLRDLWLIIRGALTPRKSSRRKKALEQMVQIAECAGLYESTAEPRKTR